MPASRRCRRTTARNSAAARPAQLRLVLQLKEIERRTPKVRRLQSNGMVERFHRTVLDAHIRIESRRTLVRVNQGDAGLPRCKARHLKHQAPPQERNIVDRTPVEAFIDGLGEGAEQRRKKGRMPDNTSRSPDISVVACLLDDIGHHEGQAVERIAFLQRHYTRKT